MEGQRSPEAERRRRQRPISTDSNRRNSLMRQACINSARASFESRSDPPPPPPPPLPPPLPRGNTSNSSFERLLNGGGSSSTGLRRSSSLPRHLSALDGGAARRPHGGAAYRSHFLLREEHRALLRPAQQALQRHRSRQLDSLLDAAGWKASRWAVMKYGDRVTEPEDGVRLRSVVRFDDELVRPTQNEDELLRPKPKADGKPRLRPRSMEVANSGYRSRSLDASDGALPSKVPG